VAKERFSDYVQQRQANIAERDALVEQLGLDAASSAFQPQRILNAHYQRF